MKRVLLSTVSAAAMVFAVNAHAGSIENGVMLGQGQKQGEAQEMTAGGKGGGGGSGSGGGESSASASITGEDPGDPTADAWADGGGSGGGHGGGKGGAEGGQIQGQKQGQTGTAWSKVEFDEPLATSSSSSSADVTVEDNPDADVGRDGAASSIGDNSDDNEVQNTEAEEGGVAAGINSHAYGAKSFLGDAVAGVGNTLDSFNVKMVNEMTLQQANTDSGIVTIAGPSAMVKADDVEAETEGDAGKGYAKNYGKAETEGDNTNGNTQAQSQGTNGNHGHNGNAGTAGSSATAGGTAATGRGGDAGSDQGQGTDQTPVSVALGIGNDGNDKSDGGAATGGAGTGGAATGGATSTGGAGGNADEGIDDPLVKLYDPQIDEANKGADTATIKANNNTGTSTGGDGGDAGNADGGNGPGGKAIGGDVNGTGGDTHSGKAMAEGNTLKQNADPDGGDSGNASADTNGARGGDNTQVAGQEQKAKQDQDASAESRTVSNQDADNKQFSWAKGGDNTQDARTTNNQRAVGGQVFAWTGTGSIAAHTIQNVNGVVGVLQSTGMNTNQMQTVNINANASFN